MKNHYKLLVLIGLLLSTQVHAQKYYELLKQPSPNVNEVIAAYNDYYKTHEFVKNEKTRTYKNWLKLYQHRFAPDGSPLKPTDNRSQLSKLKQTEQLKRSRIAQVSTNNKPWKPIPIAVDRNECYAIGQNGVIRAVAIHPTQNSIVLVGGLGGGLWRTNDDGATWVDVITNLPLVGMINRIVFAPSNPNIVYAATSTGIIKSVDAGITWAQTNLDWTSFFPNVNYAGDAYRSEFMYVDVHPTNPNYIIATDCSPGDLISKISRSTDGGATWVEGPSFGRANFVHDLKFHPTDGNIVYGLIQKGANVNFYRSTNSGLTFDAPTSGYPNDYFTTKAEMRGKLAVSVQAPDNVYLYYQYGELGATFYNSPDKGVVMNKVCCGSPSEFINKSSADRHFFGENYSSVQVRWATTLAVSPTEPNLVYAATNVRPRVSKDGMKTWYWDASFTPMAEQPQSNISPSAPDECRSHIHGDIQDVAINGQKIWIANDGGLSFSNDGGISFVERADGIPVNTILGFDISHRNNIQAIALDHNGLLVRDDKLYNGKWKPFGGGDASGVSINKIGDTWLYATPSGHALIERPATSIHGHPLYSSLGNISIGSGYYSGYRNIQTHPTHYYTLISTSVNDGESIPAGVYRSKDNSKTWEVIKKFQGSTYYYGDVRISFADPKTMFAIERSEAGTFLWKTNDDGLTWTDVFPHNASRDYYSAVRVALSDTDSKKVWIATTSDNIDTEQILYSNDGGMSWQNYSQGLPPFKIYSMEYQRGSNDGIYVGTAYGIYYRNANMSEWILHGTQLPAITPMYMHLDYSNEKILIGTYRGIWENDFYETSRVKAQVTADKNSIRAACEKIQFACFSALKIDNNTRWEWTFPGGIPSSSTLERPIVSYNQAGKFSVTLKVKSGSDSSSQTLNDFITVKESDCPLSCLPGKSLDLTHDIPDNVSLPAMPALASLTSFTLMGWIKPLNIQADNSVIISTYPSFMSLYLINKTNELGYKWQNASTIKATGVSIPANEWTHISFVITPDSTLIYVNGNKYSFAETHPPFSLDSHSWQWIPLQLSMPTFTLDYFKGEIDELRFYSRSLSDLEIKKAMHLIPTQLPVELAGYYQFNETSNTMAYDKVSGKSISVPSKLISTIDVSCSPPVVQLQAKAFLQAAYINNKGIMSDTLRKMGLIPSASPYNSTESTTVSMLANNEVVDWVLLELRSKTNPKIISYTQSALLLKDGTIISSKGLPTLNFENSTTDSFYVAIRHRNHLGVMTSTPLAFSSTAPTLVDFTKPSLTTYKKVPNGAPQLNFNGVTMLWAGKNPSTGEVKFSGSNNSVVRIYQSIINDVDNTLKLTTFVKKNAYKVEDINLDGRINYITDTVKLLSIVLSHPNNFFGIGLFSFEEQLP